MTNKSKTITSVVNAGLSDIFEFPVLPNGEIWVLKTLGAADINMGDNKSSVYILEFSPEIWILSLTGNTQQIFLDKEIVGDGIIKLKITRINNSGSNKRLPVWVHAYKR